MSVDEFPKERLERFRAFFEHSRKASERERQEIKVDFSFVEGHGQWEEDQKEKLKKQHRPALVMNSVLPTTNLISGQERASRLGITFKPRGADDSRFSQIMNSCYRYASDVSESIYEVSDAFVDMVIGGRGWLRLGIDFNNPDEPLGEVDIKRVHPLSIFYDPAATRYDFQDSNYLIYAKWVNEDIIRLTYSNQMEFVKSGEWLSMPADQVGESTIDREWRNTRTGQIRLLEFWYKVPKKVWMVLTPDGNAQKFDSESEAKDAIDRINFVAQSAGQAAPELDIIDRVIKQTRVAYLCYWRILEDRPSPYKSGLYPFVPFKAFHFDEVVMGIVRSLRDPQREKNKRWSQMLHMINTMAKGGWKIPQGSISQDQLAKWPYESGTPGFFFEYKPNIGVPQEIQGQNIPTSFVELMRIAEDEIRKTSGAIMELMGLSRSGDQSGKAINILQQGGATILAPLFDSLVRSQKILGKQVMHLIQQYYTPDKVWEILGEEKVQISQTVMEPMEFLQRALKSRYDAVVDVTPLLGSERERQFGQVIELLKTGVPPTPELLQILIEVSDFPNKDRYLSELGAMKNASNNSQGGEQVPSQNPLGGQG